MNRRLIAGNWKMNGLLADARSIAHTVRDAADLSGVDVMLCPPFTAIAAVSAELAGTNIKIGAQDCAAQPAGAHTGDISAAMLYDAGARGVILGHSERRRDHAESNAIARAKIQAACAATLQPLLCVGETAEQHRAGQAMTVIASQLLGSLPDDYTGDIAYEPVWAIGTGDVPAPDVVAEMHAGIRKVLTEYLGAKAGQCRILYGGSVTMANAGSLLAIADVGGLLIGGASLKPPEFLAIAALAC